MSIWFIFPDFTCSIGRRQALKTQLQLRVGIVVTKIVYFEEQLEIKLGMAVKWSYFKLISNTVPQKLKSWDFSKKQSETKNWPNVYILSQDLSSRHGFRRSNWLCLKKCPSENVQPALEWHFLKTYSLTILKGVPFSGHTGRGYMCRCEIIFNANER